MTKAPSVSKRDRGARGAGQGTCRPRLRYMGLLRVVDWLSNSLPRRAGYNFYKPRSAC